MTSRAFSTDLNALCDRGEFRTAFQLLGRAAEAQEPEALLQLALWRVSGNIIRRDLGAARDLLRRATALGHPAAAEYYMIFLANGTGGEPDWPTARALLDKLAGGNPRAAEQLSVLEKVEIDAEGSIALRVSLEQRSATPAIYVAEGFLSEEECNYLKAHSQDKLQPSLVIDPASGLLIPHPIRRSDGAMFGVFDEDLVVNAINRKIAALTESKASQGEPLQILRYRQGGEYQWHLDALPGADNQRIMTALVYLTNGYEGGQTQFADGFSFKGRAGDALVFRNVVPDGRPDVRSRHAGLPVRSGEKIIASRWIREEPFSYPAPIPAIPG